MKLGQQALEALQAEITGKIYPGDDLVVAGETGISGTLELICREWDKLRTYFSESFLRMGVETLKNCMISEEDGFWKEAGFSALYFTEEGGILSGTVSASENPANAEAGKTETNITNNSYEKMTREKEQIINTRMEDYLNAIAAHALEKEIDITNSYRNLGADNRTWYFKYQNTPVAYEKDIKTQYLVKINWKTE